MELIVNVRSEAVQARLRNASKALQRSIRDTVEDLATEVQRAVKQDKLTGQVLHVRSGTLRRSINKEVRNQNGRISAIVGTNVEYAGIHEYGGTILMKPRERTTYFKLRRDGTVGNRFVKKGRSDFSQTHAARSMGTYITMPERSFLRSTLSEFAPRITRDLREAVLKVLHT